MHSLCQPYAAKLKCQSARQVTIKSKVTQLFVAMSETDEGKPMLKLWFSAKALVSSAFV